MSVRSYLVDAFNSLGARINKRTGGETQENAEGVIGTLLPELTLDQDDESLVSLSETWEKTWNESDVKSKWQAAGDENEKYWKGDHYETPEVEKTRAVKDNAIFEGLETYLPQVTRRNPEPMVALAVSEAVPENPEADKAKQAYAHALQLELAEIADEIKLRLKLKGTARHWSIRLLGAVKMSWDAEENRPSVKVTRPTKLLLDPEATVDEDNYTGERIGEHRRMSAAKLVALIQKSGGEKVDELVQFVTEKVNGEMATELGFIEWWTPDYLFWKMDSKILFKKKNPHWNYDEVAAVAPVETSPEPTSTADNGMPVPAEAPAQETAPEGAPELPQGAPALPQIAPEAPAEPQQPRKGVNHFKKRKMPFILLSIYNLGKQPVDMTSLMGQNLSNQDLINKRIRQIDKNADTANNGMVVSLERSGLTKDQATRVTAALRNGGVVAIPAGAPQEAIYKPPMNELPVYVYNQLVDTRNRVRDIWGTRGSSPAGLESDTTVRGKILSKGADTDRIGGGISEFLEQLADDIYNWIVQLLYVYDPRFVEQIANGTPLPIVRVSVKEGSLLPKDSTTLANQAIELSTGGKMSNLDLYKRLDYPNPEELAVNAWLEVNAPEVLYANDPRVQQVMQKRQAAAQAAAGAGATPPKPPSESINFKDLPPDGQAQMAAKAGITLHPEGIAAHAALKNAPDPMANVPLPEGAGPTQ